MAIAETAATTSNRKDPQKLDTLAAAYAEAGQFTNAVAVQTEAIALLHSEEQKRDFASRLDVYKSGYPYREDALLEEQISPLLATRKFAEAEPLARQSLSIRERQMPDDWQMFNTRSLLGGCLLGQKKYAESEPLLLSGYEGMKQREERIPAPDKPRLKEALQRLVQLYEATSRSDQAAEWKQKLAESEQAETAKPPAVFPPK